METKALLKLEKKFLKHCEHVLTNVKVLYWKNDLKTEKINLMKEENNDLLNRIILRNQISELNKTINHHLVSRLKKANLDTQPYMKNYWDEIIEGFGNTKNQYSTPKIFREKFLDSQDSPLYRKFADCLTEQSMQNYIIYLKYYLSKLKCFGHKEAIDSTKKFFVNDDRIKAYYQEPALPNNWTDIYKQVCLLGAREHLLVEKKDKEIE